jgi:hypothetical protein
METKREEKQQESKNVRDQMQEMCPAGLESGPS